MPYKKPGAYARFVRTTGAVNNAGSSRVMAIVGTGKLFFDKLNEPILRQTDSISDLLGKENVYEIHHVTSKPLKNGAVDDTGIEYKVRKGTDPVYDLELKDGKYISWKVGTAAAVSLPVSSGTEGSDKFATVVHASKGQEHLIVDGQYKIEITYIDTDATDATNFGTYAVIDMATNQVLGEYQVGNDTVDIIPGIQMFVTDTFFQKMSEDATPVPIVGESISAPGDYVIINTTSAGSAVGAVADGSVYYVSYAYKKAEEDFNPKLFTDYQDLVAEYGDYDVTVSGKVTNSLSLGAEIAFMNGMNPIVCVQAKNDSDYSMKLAIDLLERDVAGVDNINTIIPLTTSKIVAAHAMSHVNKMSLSTIGKERMTYIGAPTNEKYTDSAQAASDFNDERLVYVVPGSATKSVRDTVTGRISVKRVPSSFLAVAVAALGLKNDPAEPLTNKFISGFDAIGTPYAESEKNVMAEKGCLILEQQGPNVKVRHGMTTFVAEVNSNEITLVQIKDYVIEAARKTLGNVYVGKKLMPSIVNDVQLTLTNVLNQFVGQQVILGYSGVSVRRSKDDPRAIDVRFEIEAVYPLNYINIEFSFSGIN
ncbi:MAG: hypothetical protein K0R18_121 [Bacillales bacterium]|jgi:hypothetical protein|nr:hypothetical protein [Bacillales bacterium]